MYAAIDRLPDAAGCRAGVIRVRVARNSGDGSRAIADRANVAEAQRGGLRRRIETDGAGRGLSSRCLNLSGWCGDGEKGRG